MRGWIGRMQVGVRGGEDDIELSNGWLRRWPIVIMHWGDKKKRWARSI